MCLMCPKQRQIAMVVVLKGSEKGKGEDGALFVPREGRGGGPCREDLES